MIQHLVKLAAMGELADQINESVEKSKESNLNSFVAILVALAATFMAISNIKDGNIVQAMQQAQASAVDTWSYYQSKSTKQHVVEGELDQLLVTKEITANLTPEARKLLDDKIVYCRNEVVHFEKDKEQIKKQAEDYQDQYNKLNVHDDQFDMSEACLSIAIAMAGITALTQKRWLFGFACALTIAGFALGLAGFMGWSTHPDWLAKILS